MTKTVHKIQSISREERAKGALLGLLIGDALGLGYHWYYDLNLLKHDIGPWIADYMDPVRLSHHNCSYISQYRYEQGVRAGDNSQNGQLAVLLLKSIANTDNYKLVDFLEHLDQFFTSLNGEALSGRYTDGIIRELWKKRQNNLKWDDPNIPTLADTSHGAQLCTVLAAVNSDPLTLAETANQLLNTLYQDHFIRANQLVYALAVQALINGIQLPELADYLTGLSKNKDIFQYIGCYGSLQMPGMGEIAEHPELVSIESAKHISLVFGLDCQVTHLLPAAYYLMYRYPDNFEMATLSASNGGGDNTSRAALTGALAGALNGLTAIPQRFIDGLNNYKECLLLLDKIIDSN